jgi:hypothetical protein
MRSLLEKARAIASDFWEEQGQTAQAAIVRSGGGDDFPEVRVAMLALRSCQTSIERYRHALSNYAEDDFGDAEIPETTLAFHDRGELARLTLEGRDPLYPHRD